MWFKNLPLTDRDSVVHVRNGNFSWYCDERPVVPNGMSDEPDPPNENSDAGDNVGTLRLSNLNVAVDKVLFGCIQPVLSRRKQLFYTLPASRCV